MDAQLFETLGKYAGLAGLSIGLILVLFGAILKLNIFPKLNTRQAYLLIWQLMYLTFAVGIVGIMAWVSINAKERGSSAITGRVANSTTKRAVPDAEITLSGRPETSRTDGAGNFTLYFIEPLPTARVHLFISKDGFEVFDSLVGLGQNIESEIVPVPTKAQVTPPQPAPVPIPQLVTSNETYSTDDVASGACAAFGAWSTLCTPDKPQGWTIVHQHFELTGDRAGCRWAKCEQLGTITATKACYRFQTQGHNEECRPFSNNTGIQYSKGVLSVVWQHPS